MANTKKTAENKVTNTDEVLEKENTQLKSEMAQMKAQMELLMKQMSAMSQPVAQVQTSVSTTDRDIEVTNLSPSYLILTTNGKQDGIHYEMSKQYETVLIPESDLKQIIRAMPKTARGGYFFIDDEQFVKENKLTSVYKVILDKDGISEIFSMPVKDFVTKYQSATDAQKKIIETMAANKKSAGEYVDANILIELGKLCKRDFMAIEPLETEG